MDKFEQIRAFTKVVAAGGFAAAAREMGVTRSAVNKLVINLENDLGIQLLHRSTRKVSPTETGLAFYDRCIGILADLEEAELAVSQLHEHPQGTLRINAPMTFGTLHLAPAVVEFMHKYPDLRVQLTLNDRLIDPIEEGFDLTVRIAQPTTSPALSVHPIIPIQQILCASPAYLQSAGIPTHPDDLRSKPCLHYGYLATGNQWKLIGATTELTVPVQSVLCSNNGEVLRIAALQGLGIALLPQFIVGADLQEGRLHRVLEDYRSADILLCVLYPANRYLSTKVRLLTEFLQERFSQPCWGD